MSLIIKNANLISMAEKREKIEYDMDLLITDNKIEKIAKNISPKEKDKVIDAKNKYVLPGFINTHSHIGMALFRESTDGYTTQDWLTQKIWPIENQLTPDDVYHSSLLSCAEMIKTGTTTVNDHYFFSESVLQAVLASGIRAELTRVIMDLDGQAEKRLQEFESFFHEHHLTSDTISISVGIHGLYTTSESCLKKAIQLAKSHNLNLHMHYLENSQESQDISNHYHGQQPFEIIQKYFANTNTILAHCVKLTEEDFKVIKNLKLKVSHCPISNLKLGCGIADITKMIHHNILVSLGTDGQGSGCNLDLFDTMKFTGLLQKGIHENPQLLPAYEILKLATINGAKALNQEHLIGSIEENKLADLIILDLSDILLHPIHNIFSDIVYNAKGTNVITTIVNGKILMENRTLLSLNENTIIKNCENILASKS